MYVYLQSESGLFTVGHYRPGRNTWEPESDHDSSEAAAARVHFLNGGDDPAIVNRLRDALQAALRWVTENREFLEHVQDPRQLKQGNWKPEYIADISTIHAALPDMKGGQ